MSTWKDVHTFIKFLTECFLHKSNHSTTENDILKSEVQIEENQREKYTEIIPEYSPNVAPSLDVTSYPPEAGKNPFNKVMHENVIRRGSAMTVVSSSKSE